MSPPIDSQYHKQSGPASSFEWFTKHICSFEDLFNHFKTDMLNSNGGSDKNECVGFVSRPCLLPVLYTEDYNLLTMRNMMKLWNSIKKIAAETGLREALILCVIMQESTGNCRVKVGFCLW